MSVNQPDLVLVMTDTQPTGLVGCYGRFDARTPSLDRLAERSCRYARCYTSSPVCTPARAGLFTGLPPCRAGAWANSMALAEDATHMGRHFRRLGYQTVYVGKWHLDGHDYFGDGACPDGWDERYWYDGKRYLDDLGADGTRLWRQGLKTPEDLRRHGIDADFTWGHRCVDRALDAIARRDRDRPLLLVVSLDEPHGPCTCPYEFVEPFLEAAYPVGPAAHDDLVDKPDHHRRWSCSKLAADAPAPEVFRSVMFFGCNHFIDHEIGRLLDAVERELPEAGIVYTSDHGDLMGAHRLFGKGPAMYDPVTVVPLLVRPPGPAATSRVIDRPVGHVDLLPTFFAWAGQAAPSALVGRPLVEVAAGADDDRGDGPVFVEFNRFSIGHGGWGGLMPIRAVVSGQYKLVINLDETDELYDLDADPHELTNWIDDEGLSPVRDDLHARLLERMDAVGDPFRGEGWRCRHWNDHVKGWGGVRWEKPADGFSPPFLDYDTGRPFEPKSPA